MGAGCGDGVGPAIDASVVAGTYVLESYSGRYAATSGSFVLTTDARAERRVRFSTAVADTAREYVAVGTFELRSDSTIDFALREDTASQYIWRVHAARTGDRFTIQYPDPADGPPIIETYRRQ